MRRSIGLHDDSRVLMMHSCDSCLNDGLFPSAAASAGRAAGRGRFRRGTVGTLTRPSAPLSPREKVCSDAPIIPARAPSR